MPQVKQASKQKRRTKAAVSALGAAGLTFSLLGSATASAVPTADVAQTTAFAPNEAITLGEEEIADTSLATFYVFDKEKVGSGVQVARRGCRGWRSVAARSAPPGAAAAAAAAAHVTPLNCDHPTRRARALWTGSKECGQVLGEVADGVENVFGLVGPIGLFWVHDLVPPGQFDVSLRKCLRRPWWWRPFDSKL